MLSYRHKDTGVNFVYNNDLNGDVTVRLQKPDSDGHDIMRIPGSALLDFLAKWVGSQKIQQLENGDPRKLLGLD